MELDSSHYLTAFDLPLLRICLRTAGNFLVIRLKQFPWGTSTLTFKFSQEYVTGSLFVLRMTPGSHLVAMLSYFK